MFGPDKRVSFLREQTPRVDWLSVKSSTTIVFVPHPERPGCYYDSFLFQTIPNQTLSFSVQVFLRTRGGRCMVSWWPHLSFLCTLIFFDQRYVHSNCSGLTHPTNARGEKGVTGNNPLYRKQRGIFYSHTLWPFMNAVENKNSSFLKAVLYFCLCSPLQPHCSVSVFLFSFITS